MVPGSGVGPEYGKLFLHVFILGKYFKNILLKNQSSRKAEIYMKAF
jgi:hypothetical protein